MSKKLNGHALWQKAKNLMPGGNQLLSKRPEMFLPNGWPTYFEKSKGVFVWDLEGVKHLDMCLMGVGTNTLGYANASVDRAVNMTIKKGNMTTLNCPEEVWLAEKLVEMHPWADMVRFARSGGEANAIAIRIARAASGRENIAFCGYHGWHDWYLSSNLANGKNLDDHLLRGLSADGVPASLAGTVHPFRYNDLTQLQKLVTDKNIGVIKMEVMRNEPPTSQFLQSVRQLANENNIVLVFDECTSGFRQTFGGLHKKFGVEPDLAVFGKALGNGYAISTVIGKREVMETAQSTFISSTFWTERIGPTAALACLAEMERTESWKIITEKGRAIKTGWKDLAQKHQIDIKIQGLDAIPSFYIESDHWLEQKTLITQEMLQKNILASNLFYPSISHEYKHFERYFEALDIVFEVIKRSPEKEDIVCQLKSSVCHSSFQRLN